MVRISSGQKEAIKIHWPAKAIKELTKEERKAHKELAKEIEKWEKENPDEAEE